MASQTKVEPTGPVVPAVPARGSQTESAARVDRGAAQPGSTHESGGQEPDDDEDVSLDELMISDSNDPLEEQEGGDAQARSGGVSDDTEATAGAEESEPAPESVTLLDAEDDEEASRAAAAAAQEAAAQRAALESAARRASLEAEIARDVEVAEAERGDDSRSPPDEDAPGSGSERDTEVSLAATDDPAPSDGTSRNAPGLPERVDADAAGARMDDEAVDAGGQSGALSSAKGHLVEDEAPISEPPQTQRRDAPLPSFDIPEADARASARRGLAGAQAPLEGRSSSRASRRPVAAPLSPLSAISEEDDDDAVTHIGLPVLETSGEYSIDADENEYPSDRGGFAVADPGIAALAEYNPDLSLLDARRATTRVVQRIDPSLIGQRQREMDTMPPASRGGAFSALSAWWSRVSSRIGDSSFGADANRSRLSWLADNALRPVSLVLFGSGLGAGIMLLQLDTGAHAAQENQAVQSLKQSPSAQVSAKPMTLIERAEAGEGDALFKITNMSANERTSALTLALERGHQAQKLNEFNEFVRTLDLQGPLPPNTTVRYLGYATSPETMLPAFAHLSRWQGSRGPDILYAIWEKAPGGARAAGLAQQLLHAEDQRSKATPSLKTVLDLRAATTCEDYLRVLPAVLRDGDQRCSATLRALKHTDGCGDDGQQDCYGCLRDGALLDEALAAVERRVPPQL